MKGQVEAPIKVCGWIHAVVMAFHIHGCHNQTIDSSTAHWYGSIAGGLSIELVGQKGFTL
jgi:hypothetical protein